MKAVLPLALLLRFFCISNCSLGNLVDLLVFNSYEHGILKNIRQQSTPVLWSKQVYQIQLVCIWYLLSYDIVQNRMCELNSGSFRFTSYDAGYRNREMSFMIYFWWWSDFRFWGWINICKYILDWWWSSDMTICLVISACRRQ